MDQRKVLADEEKKEKEEKSKEEEKEGKQSFELVQRNNHVHEVLAFTFS